MRTKNFGQFHIRTSWALAIGPSIRSRNANRTLFSHSNDDTELTELASVPNVKAR